MRSSLVADAIILTSRKEVQKLAAENLKLRGVSNVLTPEARPDAADAPAPGRGGGQPDDTEALDRFPKALLVLDWELGPKACARILGHNRHKFPGQLRPILLIATQVSEQLVATAAEYGVTQIFTEAVTSKNLGGRLATLLIAESMPTEIKKVLAEAAELRHGADHKGAFGLLQKLWQKNPTNLRVKCEVAETLMALDQWENALKVLAGIDKPRPPYLRGIHLLGRCLMKLGRFDEAVAALEQANLFNPHDVERLIDLGQALMQMDRLKDSVASFDAALAVDPGARPAKIGKGQAQLVDGHVNEALSLLREITGDLELSSLFNTAAVMNVRRGRPEAGMQLYQSAVKALGKDDRIQARLYFNMGIGYRRWSKPEKALGCFETAMRLDPSFEKAREQALLVSQMPPGAAPAAARKKAPTAAPLSDLGGGSRDIGHFEPGITKVLDDADLEEDLLD